MLVDAEARLEPIRVVLDQAVRRIEQALRRAAVLHQGDHGRVGVRATESLEIPERGAAPGEDRLIVVADRGDVSMRLDEEAQQLELRVVGVLELVDQHIAIAVLESTRGRGVIAQQAQAERDLVPEVDHALLLLQRRVRLVDRGELLLRVGVVGSHVGIDAGSDPVAELLRVRGVLARRDVLVARAAEQVEQRAHVLEWVAGGAVTSQRQVV